ncbi:hypothetical protein [uncultured Paludibaculum sp.]|uniref:hypothetical protein n=1 Tax=uncultured Paludibaculum sp. TaxID=1765020 RepID=UPI002AAACC84|nr:hypothetical protein [uncultured Paludibaculum sp.]
MLQGILTLLLALQAPAQMPSIAPDWDLKPKVQQIGPEVEKLRPVLVQLQPEKWTAAGAPAAYEKQYKDCVTAIGHVQNAANRLAEQPSKLSLAVETMVRLESLIQMASSVSQAVRRYQNPAVADLLDGEIGAAGASREWLRQLVSDLSTLREKELSVAEQEAQKCRAQTLHQGNRK